MLEHERLANNESSGSSFSSPSRLVVHHLGKAGEAFLALPMAMILKTVYPGAVIEWVILDRYRAALGNSSFIDAITERRSSHATNLLDIGTIISQYHKHTIPYRPVTKEHGTWHCNAYCNYIVKTDKAGQQTVQLAPFYKQFYQNLPFHNHDWFAPNWIARPHAVEEAEDFLISCGIQPGQLVVVVSPFVSDKTIPLRQQDASSIDWNLVADELRTLGLPIIFTGTEFDDKVIPPGCWDGYSPHLSLGALMYILQTRAHLTVSGNSGIGFAALFLRSNLLMYDDRQSWKEHTQHYQNTSLHCDGDLWPMFDLSTMSTDLIGCDARWIQRRFDATEVRQDIETFHAVNRPTLEVMSSKQYSQQEYTVAEHLLSVRGHKYRKLSHIAPACRISVLVSLYNARDYIYSRLPNLLEQTEHDLEVIVIDANSPQNDGQLVWDTFGGDPRVTVIKLSQRVPLYTAWNIGLAFSRGKYITNANADDLLDPTALKTIVDWLDKTPDVQLAAGGWYEVKGQVNRWPPPQDARASENWAPGHFPVWRRDLHCELGLFDDAYKIVGDLDWWQRLVLAKKTIAKSMEPMGAYLEHGNNLFHVEKKRRLNEIKMAGWPHYHKYVRDEIKYITFPKDSLRGMPINSPKEGDDLSEFRNRHLGERCFIMGNGPSLNKMDLSQLNGEVVFAANGCYLLFDRIQWRPTYYSCVDSRVFPDISNAIVRMHETNPSIQMFLPSKLHIHDGTGAILDTQLYVPKAHNRFFFNHVQGNENNAPWGVFSLDVDNHVVMPHTVTITLLQLAVYMGFTEIYLIGCDTSYQVPTTVIQEGPEYRDYGKLFFTSTADDDPNHFDPRYFGAGKKWHNPKVGEMIKHYGWAKRVITACGANVYNATVGGNLEVFPRAHFNDLFKPQEVLGRKVFRPSQLPRIVILDITKCGDGTATGELKASLFADWPKEKVLQFYSHGQGALGADGPGGDRTINDNTSVSDAVFEMIREFSPEIILYRPVPDDPTLHDVAMKVIHNSDLPLVVWIMDDWPAHLEAENANLYSALDKDLRELLLRASLRLSICDAMSRAFSARYQVPFKAYANAIEPREWPNRTYKRGQSDPFVLRYCGGLATNMGLDSIMRTARAVDRLAANGIAVRFEINTRACWKRIAESAFRSLEHTVVTTEAFDGNSYRRWLCEADALLIAYNFDDKSKAYTRYSFANKLPESLASGVPVIAHGPDNIATIEYLSSLGCAITVVDEDEDALVRALQELISNPRRQRALAEKARSIAFTSHNVADMRQNFGEEFTKVIQRVRAPRCSADFPKQQQSENATLDESEVVSVLLGLSSATDRTMVHIATDRERIARPILGAGWNMYYVNSNAGECSSVSAIVRDKQLERIDYLRVDADHADITVLSDLPWDIVKPSIVECRFDDRQTGPLESSYQGVAEFLSKIGYVVYISEWYNAINAGEISAWHKLASYPQSLRTPGAHGKVIAFAQDPGADVLSRAFRLCIRVHRSIDEEQSRRVQEVASMSFNTGAGESTVLQAASVVVKAQVFDQVDMERRIHDLELSLDGLVQEYSHSRRVMQICDVAKRALPMDAVILVISKGDDQLLWLDGRQAWHFPQTEDGVYAGHHPANSDEAITELEILRSKGANYLLVPDTAFWWLDHYIEFGGHLERNHERILKTECCVIYRLKTKSRTRRTRRTSDRSKVSGSAKR